MARKVNAPDEEQAFVNQELKSMAYSRLIKGAQRQMSTPDRLMSKIIHQPGLEALSELLSKIVARPLALVGAGAISLFGSLAYYFVTQHYGYAYNFSVFLVLIIGGFLMGLGLEGLWKTLKHLIFRRK